ncbi:MAG: MarR family transcriptional regulator [Solobacterium sp.]|nr:MarR family transcriptional regulator [Solobacterium sp.]
MSGERYECIRLENQLCFPLYACAKEVVRRYRKPLDELGLTYTRYVVMMVLWEHGTMSEGELGKKVHLDSGTLAPLLKRLEKQGMVKRIRPETDERTLMIELSEAGDALREKAVNVPAAMQGCLDLTPEEIVQLKTILDKALARMEE